MKPTLVTLLAFLFVTFSITLVVRADSAGMAADSASNSLQIVYVPSDEDFANPERGFMKQSSIWPDEPFKPTKISAKVPSDSVVWVYFRLDNYRDKLIDPTGLSRIREAFTTARAKGIKLVIRFVYNDGPGWTNDPDQANPDAPIDLALQHIAQVEPIIVENTDVIAAMQVGFVGHWGEWHSSKYLHSLENRRAIVDALLDALPEERMLQIRYPRYKEIFFHGPLGESQAFKGTDASRIGHHNDCFLSDEDDAGTYRSRTPQPPKHESLYCEGSNDPIQCWKDFIAQEGRFTPVGGETCRLNPPRTDCPIAVAELEMLHWSFINNGYREEVLDSWEAGGCMDTIRRRLGYRLVLNSAFIPQSVQAGATLNLEIHLTNVGFAAMFNPRPVFLVLEGEGQRHEIPLADVDPRCWESGQDHTIAINMKVPANIVPGTYKLALWLPDLSDSLDQNPAYSVRFANKNVWDATTGLNILTPDLQVIQDSSRGSRPTAAGRDLFSTRGTGAQISSGSTNPTNLILEPGPLTTANTASSRLFLPNVPFNPAICALAS